MSYLHAETRKIVDRNITTATFGDLAAPIALLNVALPTKRSRMTKNVAPLSNILWPFCMGATTWEI